MSDTPETPSTPTPTPVPATGLTPPPAAPAPSPLRAPVAPAAGLRPPTPGLTPPPAAPLRAPIAAPAASAKLPERPAFVSPMPVIEDDSDSIPAFLPIVAGFAAAVAIAFAALLFLKN